MDEARSLTHDEVSCLLIRTSRTFALAIPCLPVTLNRQVGTAYLLFRIIDSVEDGDAIDALRKCRMLRQFAAVLGMDLTGRALSDQLSGFVDIDPSRDEDELQLHRLSASVVATARSFDHCARDIIFSAVRRSAAGMSRFVSAGDHSGSVQLRSGPELHEYCFCVAGVVGEMLTQLFVEADPSLGCIRDQLMIHSPAFGEALQLVNILRDSDSDGRQKRRFIPPDASRDDLMLIASRDLDRAEYYIELLKTHAAAPGVIQFTEIPVRLARETLREVERQGPGARVSRSVVMRILGEVMSGTPEQVAAHVTAAGRPA